MGMTHVLLVRCSEQSCRTRPFQVRPGGATLLLFFLSMTRSAFFFRRRRLVDECATNSRAVRRQRHKQQSFGRVQVRFGAHLSRLSMVPNLFQVVDPLILVAISNSGSGLRELAVLFKRVGRTVQEDRGTAVKLAVLQ